MSNKEDLVTQVLSQQRDYAVKTASLAINEIHENLVVKAKTEDLAKIPEDIFKQHFLPFFSGKEARDENKNVLGEWIGIAGSPVAEVNVIDNEGKVLFTVPPIFDSTVIKAVQDNLGKSFSDIYALYRLHSNNLPAQGENFLTKELSKKYADTITKSELLEENSKKWEKILNRYDGNNNTTPNTEKKTIVKSNPDDEVDYE